MASDGMTYNFLYTFSACVSEGTIDLHVTEYWAACIASWDLHRRTRP